MAFDTIEEAAKTGQKLVTREGWLGWVLVAATFLLAFYVWDSYQQTNKLTALLTTSQELQRETLNDRQQKTQAMDSLARATENLAERSRTASENLQQLVTLVTVGYRIDEERTSTILKQLEHVASASEISAEEIRKLRMLFKESPRERPAGNNGAKAPKP